jgi:hypothetical protein
LHLIGSRIDGVEGPLAESEYPADPGLRRMIGRTARVTFIGPKRLVSNCRRICAGEISSK